MIFNSNATLLDAIVLALLTKDDAYGYKITQDVRQVIEISESTLYPVLRRLEKDSYLETYDKEFAGRNRRYYKITEKGRSLADNYLTEWNEFKEKFDKILNGGVVA